MLARQYRKKPVVIHAIRWDGTNPSEVLDFCEGKGYLLSIGEVEIRTLEGAMIASRGDWIIKGILGEFYPCKPDIFEASYELA